MDTQTRLLLDGFLVAVFPLLQAYLVLLLKQQIDHLHQSNAAINKKADAVLSNQAEVAHQLESVTNTVITPEASPVIPPAKGV